jgi:hypothetical protein
MKKTVFMLAAFALLFGAAIACFSPSPKADPNAPMDESSETASADGN